MDVGEGVVGLQPPRLDPVAGEDSSARPTKGGHRRGALVGLQLGVGEPGVVVDDRVDDSWPIRMRFSGAVRKRSPVTAWPGRVKRWKRLVSICSRSPGQGHSKRRTSSLAGRGRRERPRRSRQRETVAWGSASSVASRRGPQPVRRGAAQTRSWSRGLESRGWRRGAQGRSSAQLPEASSRVWPGGSGRSSTGPSTPTRAARPRPGGATCLPLRTSRRARSAASGAATYACPASGCSFVSRSTHSLGSDPDAYRSRKVQAGH